MDGIAMHNLGSISPQVLGGVMRYATLSGLGRTRLIVTV